MDCHLVERIIKNENTDHVGSSLAMMPLGELGLVAVGRLEAVGEGAPDCLGHCVELCNYVGKEGGRNGERRVGGLSRYK